MNLIFDLGNTLQKCAVDDNDAVVYQYAAPDFTEAFLRQIFDQYPIRHAVIAAVNRPDPWLELVIRQHCTCLVLDHTTPLPIQNRYATPETLGKDRLACAVGAFHLFPGKAVLTIDAGTCIKYDVVDAAANYHGGAISPGLTMRLKAMHNFTARLPLIEPPAAELTLKLPVVGNDTAGSMLSGTYFGALNEVEGMIRQYEEQYPDLTVVMTGGDASFFELHLKRQIFARPNLVIEGLNTILNYNLNHH